MSTCLTSAQLDGNTTNDEPCVLDRIIVPETETETEKYIFPHIPTVMMRVAIATCEPPSTASTVQLSVLPRPSSRL